jgi:hypothetical protein
MSLDTIMNYDESIKYLKSIFTIEYSNFIKNFSDFKFNNAENFSYVKIDNYAVTNITTIYKYDDLINWAKNNNIKLIQFDISNYLQNNSSFITT